VCLFYLNFSVDLRFWKIFSALRRLLLHCRRLQVVALWDNFWFYQRMDFPVGAVGPGEGGDLGSIFICNEHGVLILYPFSGENCVRPGNILPAGLKRTICISGDSFLGFSRAADDVDELVFIPAFV